MDRRCRHAEPRSEVGQAGLEVGVTEEECQQFGLLSRAQDREKRRGGKTHGCGSLSVAVDLTDPVSVLDGPLDPVPGWFGSPVEVTPVATDTGSGLGPVAGADAARMCAEVPLPGSGPVAAGICVSIDGGPFRSDLATVSVGPGSHVVRMFAVDEAGRRGPLVRRLVRVDVVAPASMSGSARRPPTRPAGSTRSRSSCCAPMTGQTAAA